MAHFGSQPPNTQHEPVFAAPHPDPTSFTYTPHQDPTTASLKPAYMPYTSEIPSPPYGRSDPKARSTLRNVASKFWFWEMRHWFWELGASAITLLITVLICWELMKLDGTMTSKWFYSWSPTSILALAVTIVKASMMVPVASSLGQLKWHWFKTPRKIDGLEHFDGASRGILGSLRLLVTLRFWHIASLGAIITVCTLSMDSLTQNAVRIKPFTQPTYESWVARNRNYTTVSSFGLRDRDLPPSEMLNAVLYTISAQDPWRFDQTLASCQTGNCTFGKYDSIAVDSQCVPVKTERSTTQSNIYFHPGLKDNGFYLNTSSDIIKSSTTFTPPAAGTYKNLGTLISRWLVLANPSVVRPNPIALECAFYWTVKTYQSEMRKGFFYENVTSTFVNATTLAQNQKYIYMKPDECWRDNQSLPTNEPNCTNTVLIETHDSLRSWFNLSDFSLMGSGTNDTQRTDKYQSWSYSSIFMQSLLLFVVDKNQTAIAAKIVSTANTLSSTVTTYVRQRPEIYGKDGVNTFGFSKGTTIWAPQTVYVIHWRYLIFPLGLIGISWLFFLATVIFTWGEGGWKSSQLAVVFHGLSEDDLRAVGSVKNNADMREVGNSMHVKLQETPTGRKLVSENAVVHR